MKDFVGGAIVFVLGCIGFVGGSLLVYELMK
jgi:hypothetical protein